ncbi:MAG: hypothetical protein KDA91_13905 [Planctomycetaceae bacterium]|nr:hypothetical protein [Planctomycetaceae bacterium]
MTIKYTCTGCGSVMKIKDEKAGTNAKCPKCQARFVVPLIFESASESEEEELETVRPKSKKPARKPMPVKLPAPPDDDDDDSPSAGIPEDDDDDDMEAMLTSTVTKTSARPNPAQLPAGMDDDDDDLDLPLDVTPDLPKTTSKRFDPLDALSDGKPAASRPSGGGARKASVADMMRGFDAGPSAGASAATQPPVRESSTVSETTGTAAEALARAYQQKRDNASTPKPKKAELSEEQQLFIAWLKSNTPMVAGVLLAIVALFWWMGTKSYSGPPLATVTGTLTMGGVPVQGYTVRFVPKLSEAELTSSGGSDAPIPRSTSDGVSDDKGKFDLMFTAEYRGSCLGEHTLEILDPSGLPINVPESYLLQDVPEDGLYDLVFDIN